MKDTQEFSNLRKMLFPIHQSELRKFIPLTSIFLLIAYNYSTLRSLKDMFLLQHTAPEVIYYIKLVAVIPSIVVMTILYSKVSKSTDRDGRFNAVITYFLAFFAVSYFLLVPNLETLKLDTLAQSLTESMPMFKSLWEVIRVWPLTLIYVHAEGWGTMALGVAFWTFVNEITSVEQSRRFYSFLSIGSAVGGILAGNVLKHFQGDFSITLSFVLVAMVGILVIYNIFAQDIKKSPTLYQVARKPKKKKEKLSFMDSVKFLMKSDYLAQIATLVIVYGSTIALFESVWKAKIKDLATASADSGATLAETYGNQAINSGILSIILIIFLAAPIMRRGWHFAASFTPVVTLSATLIFFSFLYFQEALSGITAPLGMSPLQIAVTFGGLNVAFIKSTKYILFDPTKEQAYIPLDEESKVRGKAAVDGAGSRLGKSLGSFIVTIVSPIFGSIDASMAIIFGFILIMLALWLRAVAKLSVAYKKRTEELAAQQTVSA